MSRQYVEFHIMFLSLCERFWGADIGGELLLILSDGLLIDCGSGEMSFPVGDEKMTHLTRTEQVDWLILWHFFQPKFAEKRFFQLS